MPPDDIERFCDRLKWELAAERTRAVIVLDTFREMPVCSWTQLLITSYRERLHLIDERLVQVQTLRETGQPPFGTQWP